MKSDQETPLSPLQVLASFMSLAWAPGGPCGNSYFSGVQVGQVWVKVDSCAPPHSPHRHQQWDVLLPLVMSASVWVYLCRINSVHLTRWKPGTYFILGPGWQADVQWEKELDVLPWCDPHPYPILALGWKG